LQKLKTCCAVLHDSLNQDGFQNEERLSNILSEVMMELNGGETMMTFEFPESGLVKSLLNYLSNGIYLQVDDNVKDQNADHFYAMLKRFQSCAHSICFFKNGARMGDMLLTLLVRKLQNAMFLIFLLGTQQLFHVSEYVSRRMKMKQIYQAMIMLCILKSFLP
jgi:E3 ubiquitin-protein ligase TRIP12